MRRLFAGMLLSGLVYGTAVADDLYTVTLHSSTDATALAATGVHPLLRAGNTYVVLGEGDATAGLARAGLDIELIARSISPAELAIDRRLDRRDAGSYPVLFEQDHLRLLRVPADLLRAEMPSQSLLPVGHRRARIVYEEQRVGEPLLPEAALAVPLDSIAGLVRQDSVSAYLHRLQAFYRRVTGTDSCNAAREWIRAKYQSFGYDSIYIDRFSPDPSATILPYANVVVTKVGTTYPDIQIVVGGHFDGVAPSPAADDNGTGTVGTLEIARVLAGFETQVTIVFIAFDAEEVGLWGSWHYADQAAARGDRILAMWNMDMIGHITNTNSAKIYHGANTRLGLKWITNAGPLVGIGGMLQGSSGGSDHVPFDQNGYAAFFLQEFNFSTVYHSARDSTSYINFDYLTRMMKASAATIYGAAEDSDLDGDGIPNATDNCVVVANGTQVDFDGDGYGDPCDNCAQGYNPDQADFDGDRIGDVCDLCPADATNDGDHDGNCENNDNCPGVWNAGQEDKDGNGTGDACQYTPPSYTVEAAAAGDSLGFRISCAGDVNNDGFDDIFAGAPGGGAGGQGEAYVFSGLDGSLLITITGEVSGDQFGFSVAIIPDLNGDGRDDLCAGAPRHGSVSIYAGKAYLFMAPAGPYPVTLAASAADHVFAGTSLAQFIGTAVAAIGDVDGDTTADLAVGAAPLMGVIDPGEVHVYSGRTQALLYTVAGEVAADWFGYDVAAAGDVNDDGAPDFIVGSPKNYQGGSESGRAYIFSGTDGAPLDTLFGDSTYGQFGYSVAGVGDLNDDGFDDVMVGAPFDRTNAFVAGRATVYSGQDGSVLHTFWGHAPGDGVGVCVGRADDFNLDSVQDLFVGGFAKGYYGAGKVELYSGKDGAILHTFLGDEEHGAFGTALCGMGDLDGDGRRDLAVGAFLEDGLGYDAGELFVFALGDPDADGYVGVADNCPLVYNPDQADFDGDGQGDLCDACPSFATPYYAWFQTGDVDSDGDVTVADILLVVEYLFRAGVPATPVTECADVDCSDRITAADLVYLINYVFKAGASPCDVCALSL